MNQKSYTRSESYKNMHMNTQNKRFVETVLLSTHVTLHIKKFTLYSESNVSVILLPAHPASFEHNFVSGMQSFYFSESQDAIVLQTCH